ncbi:hypothetical protein L211DRAFT_843963 [Terfezia boudieri ATCC MYA-4762]|uniref:Uncharacterized protein n=1 Tax=Terfezia boudieri ATCC MYA-4762 TaxID=1051890 RepID=A0A3N4L9L1_9PEZI|nr:hypothetical protein L211DRAFT_843963 [Terfezia boudieri ATCC MYA-4762]
MSGQFPQPRYVIIQLDCHHAHTSLIPEPACIIHTCTSTTLIDAFSLRPRLYTLYFDAVAENLRSTINQKLGRPKSADPKYYRCIGGVRDSMTIQDVAAIADEVGWSGGVGNVIAIGDTQQASMHPNEIPRLKVWVEYDITDDAGSLRSRAHDTTPDVRPTDPWSSKGSLSQSTEHNPAIATSTSFQISTSLTPPGSRQLRIHIDVLTSAGHHTTRMLHLSTPFPPDVVGLKSLLGGSLTGTPLFTNEGTEEQARLRIIRVTAIKLMLGVHKVLGDDMVNVLQLAGDAGRLEAFVGVDVA